ncbi:MAG: CCA tRNA nucleotidyltransferase [Maricaulaceae bacterium]
MKLDPKKHNWLQNEAATALFEAFPEGTLRFVGGCVRNALMGYDVGDIDLATQLEPMQVMEVLRAAKIKYVETGLSHGTLTAVINGVPYEITSLRRDVETDGRRAVVSFTTDWAEDAQRRDLTVNAIYADQTGALFDPTGEGLADLEAGRLRFVGKASERIEEDYLRLLRYFRFVAWYGGDAPLDKEALTASRDLKRGLKTLSAERIWSELKKLLLAPDPSRAVRIMSQQGVLETLLPEASNAQGLELYVKIEQREGFAPDPLARLMALSARDSFQIAGLAKRLKMSNAESTRLRAWADDDATLDPYADDREKFQMFYKSGQAVIIDRARLRAAGEPDVIQSAHWISLAEQAASWTRPEFPLSGKDLQAAGVEDGPKMGRAMKALEALWIRSGFTADKDKLLTALKMFGLS